VSELSSLEELFAGRHFDREVILLCVRWYLRYKLSFRDLVATTIAGVELLRRIHKDQFALNRLQIKGQAAPAIWNAVLAA
jgi:hypothetical protein